MQAKTQLTQSYGTVDFEIHQKSRAKNAKNADDVKKIGVKCIFCNPLKTCIFVTTYEDTIA